MNKQNIPQNKKVAVGLSGGVDSSVAAFLLKEQGYDVVGVHIQCWEEKADGCTAEEDRSFAVKVASKLGIKFVHLDFKDHYKSKVISYFYDEYRAGRTPNPDVMCNKEIKFGLFYEWAMENGFDYVSTGHYCNILKDKSGYSLKMGSDITKDQSYFLYLLDQKHLEHTLFPLGELKKSKVRDLAETNNLPTADRPDSTGICFIGEIDVKDFLKKEINPKPGRAINLNGEDIGTHEGIWYYTVGQRHGFKIEKYQGVPMYVVSKDPTKNQLVVGSYEDVKKDSFMTEAPHWLGVNPLDKADSVDCMVRIRHLGELYKAKVLKKDKGLKVEINKKVFGIAPGQSAVFYKKDVVLGGAVIS